MLRNLLITGVFFTVVVAAGLARVFGGGAHEPAASELAPFFAPPPEYENDLGKYRSPLLFESGKKVATAEEWGKRREEILREWHGLMGAWPEVIAKPKLELLTNVVLGCKDGDGNIYVVDEHAERLWLPERHAAAIKTMLLRYDLRPPGGLTPLNSNLSSLR